jgi:HEAT repeat protein
MIISRRLLITLLLVIVIGITSVILLNIQNESLVLQMTESPEVHSKKSPQAVNSHFESVSDLPSESDNTAMTNRDSLETKIEDDPAQANKTLELINSSQKEERGAAIQQLGAYPNQASETVLTQLLVTDQDASVRNAAALSLGIIYKPKDATIHALIDAVQDESEEVRFTALATLENFILHEEDHSEKATAIKLELESIALNASVSDVIKEAIKEIVQ